MYQHSQQVHFVTISLPSDAASGSGSVTKDRARYSFAKKRDAALPHENLPLKAKILPV